MPIARRFLAQAANRPQRTALRCGDRTFRYGELADEVVSVACAWGADGLALGRDDIVAIRLGDPVDTLIAVLAATYVGATPLVCDPAWSSQHTSGVLATIAPAVQIAQLPAREQAGRPMPEPLAGAARESNLACFTSGSTSQPRAVARTGASWAGSYDAVSRLTGITDADTVVVPEPLSSSLSAFAALHALVAGATLVLTSPRPQPFRDSLAEADVVHLVPAALDTVLAELESGGCSRLRTVVVGGAALPRDQRERAVAAGLDVVTYYGATELSFVAADTDGRGLRPFPGVDVDVRAQDGRDVGEVWVRSAWVATGYVPDTAVGPLRGDGAGWVTVGDVADVGTGDGVLRLRGRGGDAVMTGAATVLPEDVESVLAAVPGVTGVVVLGTGHERLGSIVTAVVETAVTTVARGVLEAAARSGLAPTQRPRRWLAVDTLPRTSAGKPARAEIAGAVADGTLPTRVLT